MASTNCHISINDFDTNVSTSGQYIAEETRGRKVENGAFQDIEANLALYSISFSSQKNRLNP